MKQAEAMIGRALNAGINYIDTAYPYHKGESEPFLGRALKKYPRNSFYLATKLPVWLVNSVEDAERLFKEQLSRLQTKYILLSSNKAHGSVLHSFSSSCYFELFLTVFLLTFYSCLLSLL